MEILEAYDLTRSYRAAASLCGVDAHTVRRHVAARAAGLTTRELGRPSVADAFADKVAEWVERSNARVRADVVHRKLVAMGYPGSERTTRRVVALAKAAYRRAQHRVYRPWVTEPGLWLQWDYAKGPDVAGGPSVIFCAWLAWSRYRVLVPMRDKALPSVIAALDTCFRYLEGAPTYCLTDNEKTVTDRHIAGIAVRNPAMVSAAHYYGVSIVTCVPYDPESKGGSEATVRVAKADLVPTETNLLPAYTNWDELVQACIWAMAVFNTRLHKEIAAVPAERVLLEREHLHQFPDEPYTAAFGETRVVSWSATIYFRDARYSVPHQLAGGVVWARAQADQLVVMVVARPGRRGGTEEVARHRLVGPGQWSIDPGHYPERRADPLARQPRARNRAEAEFLALGEGAQRWLVEAAAAGARGIEATMADAVSVAKAWGAGPVDGALGLAAFAGRFRLADLVSILKAGAAPPPPPRSSEEGSLQPGTGGWAGFGEPLAHDDDDEGEQ